jgi:transcriptional regulator NrdR family protein
VNPLEVVKRDGAFEEFMPEKIVVSCVKCGATPDVARQISKAIETRVKDKVSTSEIRKMALEQLRQRNRQWEENWLTYDKAVKKTSGITAF